MSLTKSSSPASPRAAADAIKAKGTELGFDLVGIAAIRASDHRHYLRRWLDDGKAGEMHYLAERFDERVEPTLYLSEARTVVCVAMNYHVPLEPLPPEESAHHGRVARYALGKDYHAWIKDRLYDLADWIRDTIPGARTRCGVDTVPVLERELAARAGIGWVGKNTCIINPRIGSWLLLGEVLTTLDLPVDEPETDHCGTCTRCLDACPTQAITGPYELDARRCISYLTIEHRGEIEPELKQKMGDWLYGCDVCQDVCPHNQKAPAATEPNLQPMLPTGTLDVRRVLDWTFEEYRGVVRHKAMQRVKLPLLQRNAKIVAENQNAQCATPGT